MFCQAAYAAADNACAYGIMKPVYGILLDCDMVIIGQVRLSSDCVTDLHKCYLNKTAEVGRNDLFGTMDRVRKHGSRPHGREVRLCLPACTVGHVGGHGAANDCLDAYYMAGPIHGIAAAVAGGRMRQASGSMLHARGPGCQHLHEPGDG